MLTLNQITKEYGVGDETVHALQGVSLHFRPHEFVAILGPSGCGKTTLLNIIGGLDHYTDGDLVIAGTSTKKYKDHDWDTYRNHRVGFIFQSYNLIPHQSVLANVELALTLSGVSRAERRARAEEALKSVGLGDQLKKKPNQMSGGQMQRVAIARALVNNPEIILADEPTGALDTVTSVQIMDILRAVSKEKLIVMVTHNPELAEKYASRIIRVVDGRVIDDTNPYDGSSEEVVATETPRVVDGAPEDAAGANNETVKTPKKKKKQKTSMSFLTALSLSLNNLMTKKARTFLTSFAGSIGIIGIALVLALSNGIQVFIDKVQEDTLSSYPIAIESTSMDLNSLLSAFAGGDTANAEPEEGYIYSDDQLANMSSAILSGYKENDLKAFREYIESQDSHIKENATVQYLYGVTPQVYINREGEYTAVSPSSIFETLMEYMGMDESMGSTMKVWDEMIDDQKLLESQYEVLGGRWPTAYNEVVLVADKNHRISDMMLYALGVKDSEQFDSLFDIDAPTTEKNERYTYEQLMGLKFRMALAADYYVKQSDGTYRDRRDNVSDLTNLLDSDKAIDVKVVGIIAASPDATATSIGGVVGYTSSLTKYIMEKTLETDADGNYVKEVVADQIANPKFDVLTGTPFYEKDTSSVEDRAAKFRTWFASASDVDLSQQYYENLTTIVYMNLLTGDGTPANPGVLVKVIMQYPATDEAVTAASVERLRTAIKALLETDTALFNRLKRQFSDVIPEAVTAEAFIAQLPSMDYNSLVQMMASLEIFKGSTYDDAYNNAKTEADAMSPAQRAEKYRIYAASVTTNTEGQNNGDTMAASLWDVYMKTGTSDSTYKSNLRQIGVASADTPTTIYLYPKSFDAKEKISEEIAAYNDAHENNEISYTDYIGIVLKSVSTILKVITYVLVAFVGISLVVSSIMIGIITYISVLERIKEIGILRAIGASKKDVSQVFLAETLIVGFAAGVIGILATLLLCVPVNIVVRALSDFNNISAQLPFVGAVVLVLISMLLTLVAGVLPAQIAAKKEPVEALRSE